MRHEKNAAGPSRKRKMEENNAAGPSRKRKLDSRSLKARGINAHEYKWYDTIASPILREKIGLTNTTAWVISTKEDAERKSVKTYDELLCHAKNATPTNKCEIQPCTGNAIWGASNFRGSKRCEDHKKDGDVFVRCSKCDTASPLVRVGGTPLCLAHTSIRVHEMPSESESIVDIRGKDTCACGTRATFGLAEKKGLACKECAVVLGALMNVTFEYINPTTDHSKDICVVDQCTTRGSYKTVVDSKLYCATHRDDIIDKDANRPFGARAMFKDATNPCPGWPCSIAGCTDEAVVERRGTGAGTETGTTETGTTDRLERLCIGHWDEIQDDGVKRSYAWTGTCYACAIYGSCTGDIRGTRDRCGTHKLPTDVDNANARCITCVATFGWPEATLMRKRGDECRTCGGTEDTRWSQRFRENLALGAFCRRECMLDLASSGATIEREKRPPRYEGDPTYRTDLAIDRGTHLDIVEIDEDGHGSGSYDHCKELDRLRTVVQWDCRPVNVYRVNPDRPGFEISEKVTKGWVRENSTESDGRPAAQRYLTGDLEIPGVKRENLDRTVGLLERAMFELMKNRDNCVVYIDYALDCEHLAPFLGGDGIEIIGASGGYADFVIVPRHNFFSEAA